MLVKYAEVCGGGGGGREGGERLKFVGRSIKESLECVEKFIFCKTIDVDLFEEISFVLIKF